MSSRNPGADREGDGGHREPIAGEEEEGNSGRQGGERGRHPSSVQTASAIPTAAAGTVGAAVSSNDDDPSSGTGGTPVVIGICVAAVLVLVLLLGLAVFLQRRRRRAAASQLFAARDGMPAFEPVASEEKTGMAPATSAPSIRPPSLPSSLAEAPEAFPPGGAPSSHHAPPPAFASARQDPTLHRPSMHSQVSSVPALSVAASPSPPLDGSMMAASSNHAGVPVFTISDLSLPNGPCPVSDAMNFTYKDYMSPLAAPDAVILGTSPAPYAGPMPVPRVLAGKLGAPGTAGGAMRKRQFDGLGALDECPLDSISASPY